MASIKQAVAWWCYVPAKLPPERFVQTVAEAGYDAIDLVPPDYVPLVRAHGLAISAIAGHQLLTVGLNLPDQHVRIASEIRANIALAQQWSIPCCRVGMGHHVARLHRHGAGLSQARLEAVHTGGLHHPLSVRFWGQVAAFL
jgi:hydroxypyruvate isomerase